MRYAVLVALVAVGTGAQASTQDTSAKNRPRFEVASVKPCEPWDAATPEEFMRLLNVVPLSGNRYYQPCTTIWQLALFAYDLHRSRLRYPPWASLEFFEIDARAGSPVGIEDMRLMVRHLLADRFAFRSHTEVVALDVHMLVLAQPDGRLGPNAGPAAIDCSPTVLEAPDDERRVHCEGTASARTGS